MFEGLRSTVFWCFAGLWASFWEPFGSLGVTFGTLGQPLETLGVPGGSLGSLGGAVGGPKHLPGGPGSRKKLEIYYKKHCILNVTLLRNRGLNGLAAGPGRLAECTATLSFLGPDPLYPRAFT